MVSKVAVIAIVAIIAVPILIGYGLNVEETPETRYRAASTSTNVTPLISTESTNYIPGDSFGINYNVWSNDSNSLGNNDVRVFPNYQLMTTASSIPIDYRTSLYNAHLPNYAIYELFTNYNLNDLVHTQLSLNLYDENGTPIVHADRIFSVQYDESKNLTIIQNYNSSGVAQRNAYLNAVDIQYMVDGYYTSTPIIYSVSKFVGPTNYVDLSKGYTLMRTGGYSDTSTMVNYNYWVPTAPVSSAVLTVDTSTFPNNTEMVFNVYNESSNGVPNYLKLRKIEVPILGTFLEVQVDIDQWQFITYGTGSAHTYQIYFNKVGWELHYIGDWPTVIGLANTYRVWSGVWQTPFEDDIISIGVPHTGTTGSYDQGIKLRVDYATLRAMREVQIKDYTYVTTSIVNGGASTIFTNITKYGTSLEFGGHTYAVSNGVLEIAGRNIPLRDLVLTSEPKEGGGYTNLINGIPVSDSVEQSNIAFNGVWYMNVLTSPLESYTVNIVKWVPGHFAWQGIDDNFLIVGIITSVGAFIGLAMYGRRSGAKVLPLMLVCGGAAFLFILML